MLVAFVSVQLRPDCCDRLLISTAKCPCRTLSHGYSCRARNFISAVAKLRGVKVEKLNPGAWNLSTRAAPRLFRYLVDLLATLFPLNILHVYFLRGSYLTFQLYAHGVALGSESIGFISFGEKSEISARARDFTDEYFTGSDAVSVPSRDHSGSRARAGNFGRESS